MQEWGNSYFRVREISGVRGLHGVGKVNEAGTSLLTFLCTAWTVCNENLV